MKKYQVYSMRGSDITIMADDFKIEEDCVKFYNGCNVVSIMIKSNIVGIEEIKEV